MNITNELYQLDIVRFFIPLSTFFTKLTQTLKLWIVSKNSVIMIITEIYVEGSLIKVVRSLMKIFRIALM